MTKLDTQIGSAAKARQSEARSSMAATGAKVEGTVCPNCNCSNDPEARFCEECGASLTSGVCSNCHVELEEGAVFCGECGQRQVPEAEAPSSSMADVKEKNDAAPVIAKNHELSAFRNSIPKEQMKPAKVVAKQSFVSQEVISKSETLINTLKSIKQTMAEGQPLNKRLRNLVLISNDDLFYRLQYELLGSTPAFIICNISVNGFALPPRKLTFAGDVWKTVRPGKCHFSWDMKRDGHLIPDSCLTVKSLEIWVSLDIEANNP